MKRRGHAEHIGVHNLGELFEVFVKLGLHADRDTGIRDHDVGAANRRVERTGSADQRILVGDVDGIRVMGARQGCFDTVKRIAPPRHQAETRSAFREFVC